MIEKLKTLLRDDTFFSAALLILIGVFSFGLGRWSAGEMRVNAGPAAIHFSESAPIEREQESMASTQGSYVASKNSDKYHLPWCSGAQRISEENKVWFSSPEEAERLGYTPAANCPGL